MQAGFSKVDITPPLGTPMMGYGDTSQRPAEKIHDPIFVRALWAEHAGRAALVMSFDLCFVGRDDADRLKGVLGREFDLLPSHILLSATHNHAGPAMGCYLELEYAPVLRDYLRQQEAAVVRAAREARDALCEVRIRAGMAKSIIPMNRRQKRDGGITNAPNPDGPVVDSLPLCFLEDQQGKPVCLLFALSTHVVCMNKNEVSADFPGVACDKLDAHLGATCSMFLQGTGGDSRPRQLAAGRDWNWKCGWAEAKLIGECLADEVIKGLGSALKPAEPRVHGAIIETRWPLQAPKREEYEAIPASVDPKGIPSLRYRWAQRHLNLLNHGTIARDISILLQSIQLGENVRLVALEGEPLEPHGHAIEREFPNGTTFALGYANGEGMYLVNSPMLDEGGYEPISYWEYGQPSPLAKGMEAVVDGGLKELRRKGVV